MFSMVHWGFYKKGFHPESSQIDFWNIIVKLKKPPFYRKLLFVTSIL